MAATISIAPNPASDHISINFTANPLQTNYTITNLEGKIYLQGLINVSSNKINIQMLPEGMYLFNLGDYHKKFMVMN
ncbi:MAG: T9SS type A sorting domain-containing protein [Bacteroidetes bacterium]|nr:T9SS type A sorting domain-containing protein [Bacteroidota bacterium]